jgi:hypothetical protein
LRRLRWFSFILTLLVLSGGIAWVTTGRETQSVSAQGDWDYYFPMFLNTTEAKYSTSYYMITVDTGFTYSLGCELGRHDANLPGTQDSVVVLDYSYPVCNTDNTYGAELFGFGPVPLSEIAAASQSFMLGYYTCTADDNTSNLVLGIGTNNKPTSCDTTAKMTAHGTAWAGMVNDVNQWALENNLLHQVQAYGASDIELGWNSPPKSKDWLAGYGAAADSPMIHYGDAAGCPYEDRPYLACGTSSFPEWTQEDVWYVSWGFGPSLPLPLIYLTDGVHAQQWAFLSQYSVATHGIRMDFTGVFTQSQACAQWGCDGTDNTPEEAYTQLNYELNKDPATAQSLDWMTDIRWILREEAYPDIYSAASASSSEPPISLRGLIENLQETKQTTSLPPETTESLTVKLDLLQNMAGRIALSQKNPAPKDNRSSISLPTTRDPDFISGILQGGTIAGLPYGTTVNNLWQSATSEGYLQIAAGALADDPGQGALFILSISHTKTDSTSLVRLSPGKSGSLTVVVGNENELTVQSTDGTIYHFNLDTFAFE